MKKLVLMVVAVGAILAALADTEIVDGVTWSYYISNGRATVTGASPCVGKVVIPSKLGGCDVAVIGEKAFESKAEMSSVVIPDSVEEVQYCGFFQCFGLTELILPRNLKKISACAFKRLSNVKSICLPDSVVYAEKETFMECSKLEHVQLSRNLQELPNMMFYGCALLDVTIPTGVKIIGSNAFGKCYSLQKLTIEDGLEEIGNSAFYNCSSLKSLDVPESLISIGAESFLGCGSLESINISSSRCLVAETAFLRCSNLKTITVVANNQNVKVVNGCLVSYDGEVVLAVPTSLEEIEIPAGTKTIIGSLFYGAENLRRVILPESLLSIGDYAFANCWSLKEVVVPSGVATIGSGAFDSGSGRRRFVFKGPPPTDVAACGISGMDVVCYPREYGAEWQRIISSAYFGGFSDLAGHSIVEYVSAAVRKGDPTVLDVTYRVKSVKPTVKVRALAFKDGIRSFANVVRPTEFIEGTAANIGDAITANTEHKLSWKVSADWKMDLTKFRFEVLAVEDEILPLDLVKIPANGNNKPMEFSWNAITESQVFDALLWLYADGDSGLTLVNGVLKSGSTQLANGTTANATNGPRYLFSKMGFSVLTGETLNYVNDATRLGLSPSGVMQFAWRELNE